MAGHGYVRAVLHGNMEHHAAQGERHVRPSFVLCKGPSEKQQQSLNCVPWCG